VVEHFDEFEEELRRELGVREAPAGFSDRVMERIPAQPRRRAPMVFALRPVWPWAAAAMVVLGLAAGGIEHQREQRIAGERARAQVLLALRITGATLRDVNDKIAADGNSASPGSHAPVR